jgi:hypothetical protein
LAPARAQCSSSLRTGIAVSHDGRLWVADKADQRVSGSGGSRGRGSSRLGRDQHRCGRHRRRARGVRCARRHARRRMGGSVAHEHVWTRATCRIRLLSTPDATAIEAIISALHGWWSLKPSTSGLSRSTLPMRAGLDTLPRVCLSSTRRLVTKLILKRWKLVPIDGRVARPSIIWVARAKRDGGRCG